jgi:hypothetical protein
MEHYVTLFDSKYLPQGIALYRSMERWCGEFTLWVICMDDLSERVLEELNYKFMRLISLSDIETQPLLQVKLGRTVGEYCWTLTPFAADAVFEKVSTAKRVTYLDADLWFRASPAKIFEEFDRSNASVLITEHGYAPENDQSASSGFFCVQFLTFTREESLPIRLQWQKQCLEWCFNRVEDGKFGDQKYLDTWPLDYGSKVHVMEHPEWALAPWNATRFPYSGGLFFHFHTFRLISRNRAELGVYVLPKVLIENIYRPYLHDINFAIMELDSLELDCSSSWSRQSDVTRFGNFLRYWKRRFRWNLNSALLKIE